MSEEEDEIFAHLLAGEIHEEVNNEPILRAIVDAINATLGESPEAIRGAIMAFSIVGHVVMLGMQDDTDPSIHLVKLMASWQAQPHVMALLDEITKNR
jgi:hypothetical protein